MIIALYGRSSAGKTAIAHALQQTLKCEARHCGDVIRARASQLGVSLDALSLEEHAAIDHQTREWVSDSRRGLAIVEGRYLQYVLAPLSHPIRLMEVVCSFAVRQQRWTARAQRPFGADELEALDDDEEKFVARAYAGVVPTAPMVTIDTSAEAIAQSAVAVLAAVGNPGQV